MSQCEIMFKNIHLITLVFSLHKPICPSIYSHREGISELNGLAKLIMHFFNLYCYLNSSQTQHSVVNPLCSMFVSQAISNISVKVKDNVWHCDEMRLNNQGPYKECCTKQGLTRNRNIFTLFCRIVYTGVCDSLCLYFCRTAIVNFHHWSGIINRMGWCLPLSGGCKTYGLSIQRGSVRGQMLIILIWVTWELMFVMVQTQMFAHYAATPELEYWISN